MFEGFELDRIDVGEAVLRVRHGGSGPPLLLLHGHPQTHAMWHLVAPHLAAEHTVVAPDLRGYGESSKPPTRADHEPYSKRAMARDAAALMRALGFDRFAVAGHDRGARVAYRLALDRPECVDKLAVLDVIPTGETWRRADRRFMLAWWHWAFLAQPAPLPETLIGADPDGYYFGGDRSLFHPDAFADYLASARAPETIHAMCEDYRAGATYDFELDEADRAEGRGIACAVLVLWGARSDLAELIGDPLAIWRGWADDVRGRALDCGHYLAEEAPEDTYAELRAFFA